jgi:hypothetical protein
MGEVQIGDAVPDLLGEGPDGAALPLSRWWERAPLVAIYLRHFG